MSASAVARQQRALFKPFLHTMRGINMVSPTSTPNSAADPRLGNNNAAGAAPATAANSNGGAQGAAQARPHYQFVINCETTPNEREVGRTSRSGRVLSEMEVLQEKHEPEFQRLMPIVAAALKDVVAIHEPLKAFAPPDDRYSYYETNAAPPITIDAYVQRISEYTYISPSTLLCSLVILDRLAGRHPTLLFTMLNIYKIFFVAVRIASKVVDLRTLNNKNFAPVGGISNRHLNDIEARMLIDLRFDLYISPADFRAYVRRATDGVAQPIAISSQFQGAMAQMQASQAAAAQQQREQAAAAAAASRAVPTPTDQLPGGSVSTEGGLAVHGSPLVGSPASPASRAHGGGGGVNVQAGGMDQSNDLFNESDDTRRLPVNRDALQGGNNAAPALSLGGQ